MEELRRENCDVARCFRNNRQELQELEGLVAQTKEHFQMENGEAGVSVEEAQKVEGRRRPVLTGSGRGVPVLGPCSPAAAAGQGLDEDPRGTGEGPPPDYPAPPSQSRGPSPPSRMPSRPKGKVLPSHTTAAAAGLHGPSTGTPPP
ncbi:cleavage and polyadenylation specificity factor subunit 6-like isoform X2 [Grus americana]|uniref:cleavage and polyadenylation specificity factor subunit 6-like isoform X2 n=1 Tax=Grus americana TaxID=9117 RepID=UPI00240840C2|nr:cleavage and polyadenylation specificity factor subunit 6-like isoform X2 [Grus americana]